MSMKTKKFDCVEMKNRIQAKLYAEYESRKDEFSTYMDFINAKANEEKDSDFAKTMRQKLQK